MPTNAPVLLDPEFMTRLEQLSTVSRKIFRGRLKGERRSKKKGVSVEFADYRDYSQGDDPRFLDWNVYGRLDRLFLKQFLEQEDLFVYILIDPSESMGFGSPTKLGYAARVAAAIAYISLANLDRVTIATLTPNPLQFGPTRGKRQVWRMFDFLGRLEPSGATDLAPACKRFAIKHRTKGVVVVLSDFLDKNGYQTALKYFLQHQMDVFVLQIFAPEEVDPQLAGDLKLVDVEDADIAEVSVSPALLKTYQRNLGVFTGGLRDFCVKSGFAYLSATTAVPFDQLILNSLRRAGLFQ